MCSGICEGVTVLHILDSDVLSIGYIDRPIIDSLQRTGASHAVNPCGHMNAISGFGKGTEDEPFSNEYQGVRNLPNILEKQSSSRPLLERFWLQCNPQTCHRYPTSHFASYLCGYLRCSYVSRIQQNTTWGEQLEGVLEGKNSSKRNISVYPP